MKKSHYLIWMGIATATGTLAGMLLNEKNPKRGGLEGAAAGAIAGSLSAGLCHYLTEDDDDGLSYYTESSPLYEDFDTENV